MECLTIPLDIKIQVDIRSLMSDFVKDFIRLKINHIYAINLTCILQIFPNSDILLSVLTL